MARATVSDLSVMLARLDKSIEDKSREREDCPPAERPDYYGGAFRQQKLAGSNNSIDDLAIYSKLRTAMNRRMACDN